MELTLGRVLAFVTAFVMSMVLIGLALHAAGLLSVWINHGTLWVWMGTAHSNTEVGIGQTWGVWTDQQ